MEIYNIITPDVGAPTKFKLAKKLVLFKSILGTYNWYQTLWTMWKVFIVWDWLKKLGHLNNFTKIDNLDKLELDTSGPLYNTVLRKSAKIYHSLIGTIHYVPKNNNLSPDQICNIFRDHNLVVVPECPQGYKLVLIITCEYISEVFGVDLYTL